MAEADEGGSTREPRRVAVSCVGRSRNETGSRCGCRSWPESAWAARQHVSCGELGASAVPGVGHQLERRMGTFSCVGDESGIASEGARSTRTRASLRVGMATCTPARRIRLSAVGATLWCVQSPFRRLRCCTIVRRVTLETAHRECMPHGATRIRWGGDARDRCAIFSGSFLMRGSRRCRVPCRELLRVTPPGRSP